MSRRGCNSVTVSCWNVLADSYANYAEKQTWTRRLPLLRKALVENLADILLLQEIDHYEDFYKPFLEELGYVCEL